MSALTEHWELCEARLIVRANVRELLKAAQALERALDRVIIDPDDAEAVVMVVVYERELLKAAAGCVCSPTLPLGN